MNFDNEIFVFSLHMENQNFFPLCTIATIYFRNRKAAYE